MRRRSRTQIVPCRQPNPMDMFLSQDPVVNLVSLAANVAHLWQDQNILASKSQIHHVHRKSRKPSHTHITSILKPSKWNIVLFWKKENANNSGISNSPQKAKITLRCSCHHMSSRRSQASVNLGFTCCKTSFNSSAETVPSPSLSSVPAR